MSNTKARKRVGVMVTVGVAALLATACESKDDKNADKPAGAAGATTAASGQSDGAKPDDAASGKASDKPADKPAGGSTGKYTTDLKAHLATTKLGAHVVEVRADKQTGSDYQITINTDLPPTKDASTDAALKSMAMGEKITNEALQWVQAHGDLKVGYIEVLDKEKGTAGNENLDNKAKDKDANDAYGKQIAEGIKGSTYGSEVTEVFVYAGPYDGPGKVIINTRLPARTDDLEADLAMTDKAGKIAEEAKQWIQDHAGVKVDYIEVLDVERGLASNETL